MVTAPRLIDVRTVEPAYVPSLATLQAQIEAHEIEAEAQLGVHETFIVTSDGEDLFYKDYTPRHKPWMMFAERFAHRFAGASAPLFYRDPLAGYTADPAERSITEASTLKRWYHLGIHVPTVLKSDGYGILMKRMPGDDLETHLARATLTPEHARDLTDALHTARDAAYMIDDSSLFHSDPTLRNAIADEKAGRVGLIDPGILARPLPTNVLDAAFSLYYITALDASGARHGREDVTDELAAAYVAELDEGTKQTMRAYNRSVPPAVPRALMAMPHEGVKGYGRWLSSYDKKHVERINDLLR